MIYLDNASTVRKSDLQGDLSWISKSLDAVVRSRSHETIADLDFVVFDDNTIIAIEIKGALSNKLTSLTQLLVGLTGTSTANVQVAEIPMSISSVMISDDSDDLSSRLC